MTRPEAQVHVTLEDDGRTVRLDRAWRVAAGGWSLVVPAGFCSDGASIPRWLWWLLPPVGEYTHPAIAHDYLYSRQARIYSTRGHIAPEGGTVSRRQADAIFGELMAQEGVSAWKRWLILRGVRVGGRRHYQGRGDRA